MLYVFGTTYILTPVPDNISDKAYDYLMYSQWVGWPKVVLEASSAEKLARVRARCEEVMKVLV